MIDFLSVSSCERLDEVMFGDFGSVGIEENNSFGIHGAIDEVLTVKVEV